MVLGFVAAGAFDLLAVQVNGHPAMLVFFEEVKHFVSPCAFFVWAYGPF